jgi:hypothetical protein
MLWLCVSTHLMEMMVALSPSHQDLGGYDAQHMSVGIAMRRCQYPVLGLISSI